MNRNRSLIMLVTSLLIVGTIGLFRRYIPLPSAVIAFFRGAIGAVSLVLFMALRRVPRQKTEPKKLLTLCLNGIFLTVNWILLFEAYNRTTIAKATLCYYMEPTIVLLLSPLLFKERLTARKLCCAAVSLAGMVLVSGVTETGGAVLSDLPGVLFGLGAACFYALVVILNKKTQGVEPYKKTVVQLISAAVGLAPYLLLTETPGAIQWSTKLVLLLLVVGVVHTGLFYALYFGSMSGLKAQTISMLSYIDPVVAMAVSAILLREGLTVTGAVGAAIILGAAVVSELPQKQKKAQPPA